MSATSSPSPTAPACADEAVSARVPVLLLFLGSACWLVAASLLGFIATLKFHNPAFLADSPFLTYGRVLPAANNAFLYGFAMPAGLGVLLWLLCHIGRARLLAVPVAVAGCVLWNLGLVVGITGILCGGSTGFEWLELPRYASAPMFLGYISLGFTALLSFHYRAERRLDLSQWFLVTALLWFPWIFSTARLLLRLNPVRGTVQSVIDGWYIHNLTTIWFGFIGLGAAFHFVPKLMNRPLHSRGLGVFAFWTLVIFGSWGAVPPAAPVPSWIPALSTFAAIMTVVPMLCVAVNIQQTSCGAKAPEGGPVFLFISTAMMVYVLSGLLGAVTSLAPVSEVVNFTWVLPAQQRLFGYGFFALMMFGAVYHIVPRVAGVEFCSPKLISWQFGFAALGVAFYCIPLLVGGVKQGFALNDHTIPFLAVMEGTLMSIRFSTLGDVLMAAANLIFLRNLLVLVCRLVRAALVALIPAAGKTAEVAA